MKTNQKPFYPLVIARLLIGYITYFGANFIFITTAGPLLLLLTALPKVKSWIMKIVVHDYLAFFTRRWLPCLGIYKIIEIPKQLPLSPVLYVSNHRGYMDAPLLLGLLPKTGVLVKSRYTRWMLPGLLARHFDLVSLDLNSLTSMQTAVTRCRKIISEGRNMLVFPEGTRSRTGKLGRFKSVAFRVAIETKTPVVPVVVHSTQAFMAKIPGSLFPRGYNAYRIRLLNPEPILPDDSADALAERVYRRMASELKILDKGTQWESLQP